MAKNKKTDVKLENPSGKIVEVPVEQVAKQRLFTKGFKRVKGESYPKAVNEVFEAYRENMEAQGLFVGQGVDPGATGQIDDPAANKLRAGSKGKKGDGKGAAGNTVNEDADEKMRKSQSRLEAALNSGQLDQNKKRREEDGDGDGDLTDASGTPLRNGDAVDDDQGKRVTDNGDAVEDSQPGSNPDADNQNTDHKDDLDENAEGDPGSHEGSSTRNSNPQTTSPIDPSESGQDGGSDDEDDDPEADGQVDEHKVGNDTFTREVKNNTVTYKKNGSRVAKAEFEEAVNGDSEQ